MSITHIGVAKNSSTTGTAISVTHGLTILENDIVLVLLNLNGNSAQVATDNNGANAFTKDLSDDQSSSRVYEVWSRVAGASEPASYNFTRPTSDRWSISVRVFRGVDTASIYDVAPSTASYKTTGGSNWETNSITTLTDNAMAVAFWCADSQTGTASAPTNGYGDLSTTDSGQVQASVVKVIATAGATGIAGVTNTSSGSYSSIHFALKDSPAPPSLTIDSLSTGPYYVGDTVTINVSNASASGKTLSIPAGALTVDSQDATTMTFTVPDPKTFGTKVSPYSSDITITVDDGGNTDTIAFQISPTVGHVHATIAATTGIYADDVGIAIGDKAYGYWVVGTGSEDLTVGAIQSDAGGTFRYWIQDDTDSVWGSYADEVIEVGFAIGTEPTEIRASEAFDIVVSDPTTVPTVGNTTLNFVSGTNPTATINSVTGSNPYTINATFPKTINSLFDSVGGYPVNISIDSGVPSTITEVGTATATDSVISAGRLGVTLPVGLQADDIIFATWTTSVNHTIDTLPTGWVQIGTTQDGDTDSSTSIVYRIADGTEGATADFTNLFTTANLGGTVTFAYRGLDTVDLIEAVAQATTLDSTLSGPSVTPAKDGCLILQVFGSDPGTGARSFTADSSPVATKVWDGKVGIDHHSYMGVQSYVQSSAGAISLDATISGADTYSHFSIALNVGGSESVTSGPIPYLPETGQDYINLSSPVNTAGTLGENYAGTAASTGDQWVWDISLTPDAATSLDVDAQGYWVLSKTPLVTSTATFYRIDSGGTVDVTDTITFEVEGVAIPPDSRTSINKIAYTLLDAEIYNSVQVNDVIKEWLVGFGYTGAINQMLYNYLGDLGYTGTLQDRMIAWSRDL